MNVFADWLDVTYAPDDHVLHELGILLSSLLCVSTDELDGKQMWHFPTGHGTLKTTIQSGHVRISASGGFLESLREYDSFQEYLALLSCSPNRVTRLDAALDIPKDAPAVLAALLKSNPTSISLSRQRPLNVKYIMGARADGLHTGTVYAGYRSKSRVTARVYDKQAEALDNHNKIIDPTTRYEITLRAGLAGLRDALEPAAIFWAHVGDLLTVPSTAPEWSLGETYEWHYKRPEQLPAVVLQNRVAFSTEIASLITQADALGVNGRNLLFAALRKRVKPTQLNILDAA